MPGHVHLNRLSRQIQWQHGTYSKFLASQQGTRNESLDGLRGLKEIRGDFRVNENPPPAIEPVAQMIDLDHGRRQLAPILRPPGNRIDPGIDRTRRSAAMVKIHGTESNHGAERAL